MFLWRNQKKISILLVMKTDQVEKSLRSIGSDKSAYQVNIFLISPQMHMLWVLIRSALFLRQNRKNINTFGLKRNNSLSRPMQKYTLHIDV